MTAAADGPKPYYFVPQPSHWPITGSCALLLMGSGAAFWFNSYAPGPWMVGLGFAILVYMLFGWFGTVIGESEHRLYNQKVDHSFRWAMSSQYVLWSVGLVQIWRYRIKARARLLADDPELYAEQSRSP